MIIEYNDKTLPEEQIEHVNLPIALIDDLLH